MSTATMEKQTTSKGLVSKGDFVWYELMTDNPDAAQAFYGPVLGWTASDSGLKDRSYMIVRTGERQVGGMMAKALPADAKPHWVGYIAVEDVDASAARLREKGGVVHREPEDIPGIGRFAVVADPQGAMFYLFRGNLATPPPRMPAGTVGAVGWQELQAVNRESAWGFYAEMFGWHKSQAFDMGPMGVYQTFSTNDEEPMTGGMMTTGEGGHPMWRFSFNVAGINAAVKRVRDNGGSVMHGPMQVPGGRWVALCADPQGGVFGLLSDN